MPLIQKLSANFWQNSGNGTLFSVLGRRVGFPCLFLFLWQQPACTRINYRTCWWLSDKKKSTCQSRGTRVQFLVWKDSICLRAAKPVCATATRVHGQQLWQPARLKPVLQKTKEATAMRRPCTTIKSSSNSLQPEKACAKQSKTQCSQKLINNNNK